MMRIFSIQILFGAPPSRAWSSKEQFVIAIRPTLQNRALKATVFISSVRPIFREYHLRPVLAQFIHPAQMPFHHFTAPLCALLQETGHVVALSNPAQLSARFVFSGPICRPFRKLRPSVPEKHKMVLLTYRVVFHHAERPVRTRPDERLVVPR